MECGVTFMLYTLLANRMLNRWGPSYMKIKRFVRTPSSLVLGGLVTYAFNLAVLRPVMHHDLQNMGLVDKYFQLDLNADLMRQDLQIKGIDIKAKFYDEQKAQDAADKFAENEKQAAQKKL